MANELNIDIGEAGLAVTAQLIQGNAAVGSAIALTESATFPGFYSGDVPGGTAAGAYAVAFRWPSDGAGSGYLHWDGAAEVNPFSLDAQLPANLSLLVVSGAGAVTAANALDSTQTTAAATAALTDYTAATAGNVTAVGDAIAALNDLSTAEAQAAAAAALTAQGYTTGRAPFLDKLNVTGALAHSDAAALYQANVAGLSTFNAVTDQVTASNMRGTDNALLAANYIAPTNAPLSEVWATLLPGAFAAGTAGAALAAARSAAEAVADGRSVIDLAAGTLLQYNADGTPRTTFNLQTTGGQPATSIDTALQRRPQ